MIPTPNLFNQEAHTMIDLTGQISNLNVEMMTQKRLFHPNRLAVILFQPDI
jgi:hypothetical protein